MLSRSFRNVATRIRSGFPRAAESQIRASLPAVTRLNHVVTHLHTSGPVTTITQPRRQLHGTRAFNAELPMEMDSDVLAVMRDYAKRPMEEYNETRQDRGVDELSKMLSIGESEQSLLANAQALHSYLLIAFGRRVSELQNLPYG